MCDGSILSCCPRNSHGHERVLKEEEDQLKVKLDACCQFLTINLFFYFIYLFFFNMTQYTRVTKTILYAYMCQEERQLQVSIELETLRSRV